jgi:DNA-binding MarR family transcriptional regulator
MAQRAPRLVAPAEARSGDSAAASGPAAPGAPEPPVGRGRLAGLLGYHLRRAEVAAMQNFGRHLGRANVSPGQLGVLLTIEANPGINQTRVGRGLGIDRSTLVALIDRLESRGFVARKPAPSDRRSHALSLTRAGEQFLAALLPDLARHEAEIAAALSAADRRRLIALLARVAPE